jgi:NAD(P)H-nitrite reductase large subunit
MPGKKIVCFCEDLTEEDIIHSIEEGFDNIESLKRFTGAGTGACQGKICMEHVMKILARKTGKKMEEIQMPTPRQPIVPVSVGLLAGEKDEE